MKLVISEKNIAASRIAYMLSNGKSKSTRLGNIPVYEFTKDNENWKVIGLKGHIINLDYPANFNQWNKILPRDLIEVEPCKIVSEKSIAIALKSLVNKNPFIIVATDFDREGELIGVEAVNLLKQYNKDIKEIKRAKFSAITNYEITKAFENLTKVDYNLADAGEARQEIDLVWGAVLTRFISLTSNRLGKDFLSIGRVQSPTLAIIVEREKEIQNFEPKTYWKINATLKKNETFNATHVIGQFWDEKQVKDIYSKVKDCKESKIKEVKKSINNEYPPSPFNTTSFLQAASALGFPTSKAMSIAEELYMSGLISYPRTDNTVYPNSINIKGILEKLSESDFKKEVSLVKNNPRKTPTRGKKQATDHPPIHPVGVPYSNKLSKDHSFLYELICRRFLATISQDAVSETSDIKLDISGEDFITSGYRLIEPNWKQIYTYFKEKRKKLPELSKGEKVPITKINLKEDKTKPPKRYTQGALIAKMEQLSLGTKSTRHEIINKLYGRKYISGGALIPTTIAIAVIDALVECDVVKPKMTSVLEENMNLISEGKKTLQETVNESKKMLTNVMKTLEKDKEKIKESITTANKEQNTIGVCPKCGKDMIIRTSRRGERFVGCTNFPDCRNAYPLPQKATIIKTKEKCDACQAPIIKIKSKNSNEICLNPRCPKIENINNKIKLIGKCPVCGHDLIIRTSRSGDQFIGCTNFPKCKNTYSLPKNADIKSTNEICEECKTPLIIVKNDESTETTICLNSACLSRKK